MAKNGHNTLVLTGSGDSGFVDTEGHASRFIQVLDESMCVVREDLTDWLQRYLFSTERAPPIDPSYLLYRLGSGLWLSRLAYKLNQSVLQITNPEPELQKPSYGFLRGAVSNKELKTLSKTKLPVFPRALIACAALPLGLTDLCADPSGVNSSTDSSTNSDSNRPGCGKVGESPSVRSMADRWVARDNVSAFIKWCNDLGIPQTVLFETTGLVHRTEEKNVLLTLMELARIASRHGLTDLPELVRMEREIDALEAARSNNPPLPVDSPTVVVLRKSTPPHKQPQDATTDTQTVSRTVGTIVSPVAMTNGNTSKGKSEKSTVVSSNGISSSIAIQADIRRSSSPKLSSPRQTPRRSSRSSLDQPSPDETHRNSDSFVRTQVNKRLAQCNCCDRLHMQRLEEGRYLLRSRIYYLRQFKNHVMVRVGGGWLTLDAFLDRHDPCRRGVRCPLPGASSRPPSPEANSVNEDSPSIDRKPNVPAANHAKCNVGTSDELRGSVRSTKNAAVMNGIVRRASLRSESKMDTSTTPGYYKIRARFRTTTPRGPKLRTASRSRDSSVTRVTPSPRSSGFNSRARSVESITKAGRSMKE